MEAITKRNSELLRFSTCGSVDDGKSTLIGRLLYDSKTLFQDQMDKLEADMSRSRSGTETMVLANLTDGLRREREQGITIDVAYRYVATPRRKFIVADTPGHIQYTRNMVTGMSTANLAVILIDARHGVVEQTRRHSYIASLLGTPHMVICVNKMDLVEFSQERFEEIRKEFDDFATRLNVRDITFIPMSALKGDNVVTASKRMDWYDGPPLLYFLETVHIANDRNFTAARFPVQWVIRPHLEEYHDFRGYSGEIASGVFRPGDRIIALPSGHRSTIKEIRLHDQVLDCAFPPMSVTMLLEDDIDIGRGDTIALERDIPYIDNEIDAMVCWMHERPMQVNGRYRIMHNTNSSCAVIRELVHRVDVNTLEKDDEATSLKLNEIGRVKIRTQKKLCYDEYGKNRATGSFIIIDEGTNATVAAGMIREPEKAPPIPIFEDYAI